jgi:pimeloyl-ACP methyl ester carboxylesterase
VDDPPKLAEVGRSLRGAWLPCTCPSLPRSRGRGGGAAEDPSPIEALTVPAIVEHYEGIIDELDRPPIIMGHSMGGLLTQILLDHGYGAAGVAIDSVPAEGIKVVPVSQISPLPDPEASLRPS